jgi:ABC-2 type transport system permease protein
MKNKVLIVALREYLKNVRKVSFWLATLFFPLFMVVLGLISGYSSVTLEKKIEDDVKNAKKVLIVDEADIINPATLTPQFELNDNFDNALQQVKDNNADAVIMIPSDVLATQNVDVFAQSKGILSRNRYNDVTVNLIKQSILAKVGNEELIRLFNANISVDVTSYKDGQVFDDRFEKLIVPIASVIIYFMLISFGNSYLLMSVSEEKENRMIEVVLTSIKPKNLILGKIIGQVSTVITQLVVLVGLATVAFNVTKQKAPIPIDFSSVQLGAADIIMGIFYVIIGFLILGNVMVGVGAAMPTYKEAQSFSSVFIIFSILPIYFFSIILADPSGPVALFTSYFPLTAPMILLFRNALGELSTTELLLSSGVLVLYAYITYFIAVKLFEFGSLEYNRKLSLKEIFQSRK